VTEIADYQLFGLRIRSEIQLPELFSVQELGVPDVTIRRSALSPGQREADSWAEDDALWLTVPDVGRYRIEGGRDITVDPNPGVPERNVRLFLLGSAFGALLHQRGVLPLHANAIEIEGKAVAFMGESGSGKSTLAAWFHDRGYRILADDVCVVGFDAAGIPHAYPGLPRLRLWNEALETLGRDSSRYDRSYVGAAEQMEKFDVPIDPSGIACSAIPLTAIYLLRRGNQLSIAELSGIEAAEALFANTYRGSYLPMIKGQKDHWQSAITLVRAVRVYRAERQWDLAKLDEQCRRLLVHAQRVIAAERHELP
jgi:hypothetical protein